MNSFFANIRIVIFVLLASDYCCSSSCCSALLLMLSFSISSSSLMVMIVASSVNNVNAEQQQQHVCTADTDGLDSENKNNNCEANSLAEPNSYDSKYSPSEEMIGNDYDDSEDDDGDEEEDFPSECSNLADSNTYDCQALADRGECETNPGFMKYQCALSCGTCLEFNAAYYNGITGDDDDNNNEMNEVEWGKRRGEEPCTDLYQECKQWAGQGECAYNPDFMLVQCERSCMICFEDTNQFGVHQTLPSEDDEHYEATQRVINHSIEYMKTIWTLSPSNNRVNYKCRNMDEECSYWAATNKCVENKDYMEESCAPACHTCHLLDIQLRCPIEEGNEPIFKPGMLNELFENIVDDADGSGKYVAYNPAAVSRPRMKRDGSAAPEGSWRDGPWVVILENFISDEEVNELIAAGHKKGFHRSMDVGIENPDGSHEDDVSEGRTSTNAWCDEELCENHSIIRPVIERIANATGTHPRNSEHLQLLRYDPCQYYRQHHDYIEYQQGLPCGVRMLTLFLYLNDVEEGGGTRFPLLDITVQPKKGRALLWPSVLDEDPESKDKRTDHEALPVISGIKYGANAWIHSRNYREAEENECT